MSRYPVAADADAAVIQASRADSDQFAALYHRYAAQLYRYAHQRVGPQAAEDVVAETFLAAFQGRTSYDIARPDARPWLFGILTRKLARHHRAERADYRALSRSAPDTAVDGLADRVAARMTADAARARLAAALAGLSARDRDVLLLVAWGELSYDEVAAALKIPLGTVRSRLNRARRKVALQAAPIARNAPPPPSSGVQASPDAGHVLQLAARRVADAPAPTARSDQFMFVESVGTGSMRIYQEGRTANGKRVLRLEANPPRFTHEWRSVDGTHDGLERSRPYASGGAWDTQDPIPGCRGGRFAPTRDRPNHTEDCTPNPAYRADLPTAPDAMLAYLYRPGDDKDYFESALPADQKAFARIRVVLGVGLHAPAVQAAVFQAAARIPGVTVSQDARDAAGRPGVAVVRTAGGIRDELIFDATTYQYLGSNRTVVDSVTFDRPEYVIVGLHAGYVFGQTAILRVAIVDQAGQEP